MSAVAEQLTGVDAERGIEIFSRVSVSHGARPWTVEDVQGPAVLRLYRARVSEYWVLDPERRPDRRTWSGRSVRRDLGMNGPTILRAWVVRRSTRRSRITCGPRCG